MESELTIVQRPGKLVSFQIKQGEGPGEWVSYPDHPLYASFIQSATFFTKISSLVIFSWYFTVILTKRLISYETIPAHLRKLDSVGAVWRFLKEALTRILRKIANSGWNHADSVENPVRKALVANGICVAKVDESCYSRILDAAQPLFDQMQLARGERVGGGREFNESRGRALRTAHAELFSAIEDFLEISGVLNGISAYLGRPVKLVDVNPQINDVTDDFWRRVFPDSPSINIPTSYFHKDASGGDVKIIFYMTDVGEENGPFSYALGSNPKNYPKLIEWVEETNDQSGFSGTTVEARTRFSALPSILRKKAAFGNDVIAGSGVSQRILDSTWEILAPQGHIVVFDTKGIHRGGLVENGERRVITCITG